MEKRSSGGAKDPRLNLEALRDDLMAREWVPGPGGAQGVSQKVISGKTFCPGFMAALSRVAPGGEFPEHAHGYVHVFYVLEGSASFSLDGQEIRGGKGTVVRVPPDVSHGYRHPGPQDLLLLVINSPATR